MDHTRLARSRRSQQAGTRNARGVVEFAAGGAITSVVFSPAVKVCVPMSSNRIVLAEIVNLTCDEPAGIPTVEAEDAPAVTFEIVGTAPSGAPGTVM